MPFDNTGFRIGRELTKEEAYDLEALRFIRDNVARPHYWCKETLTTVTLMRDKEGPGTSVVSHCLQGWAFEVTGNDQEARRILWQHIEPLIYRRCGHRRSASNLYDGSNRVIGFNDRTRTTQKSVLNVLDRAIKKLTD